MTALSLLSLGAVNAWAVSLGKITVQSTLGQPLRAEIELPGLSPDEASSLVANMAPPASFKAAGIEYNASLPSVRFKLVSRDGRSVLQLTSDRVVNDPFLDLIVEANWASGRIVRDYTVLLDPPPELQRGGVLPPPPPPVAAVPAPLPAPTFNPPPAYSPPPAAPDTRFVPPRRASPDAGPAFSGSGRSLLRPSQLEEARRATAELAAAASAQAQGGVVRAVPTAPPLGAAPNRASNDRPPSVAAAAPPANPPATKPAGVPSTASNSRLEVKRGDTANKIATANKPATVSLDQMLAALLRQNPDAFEGGNINRLRAGTILDMPTRSQVESVSPEEASRLIVAQSRNFNDFRRRLADGVPAAKVEATSREAKGTVQAQVQEPPKSAAVAPDKLTLSKGSVTPGTGSKPSAEDKIATSRQAQDASTRVAELSRNLQELNQLKAGSGNTGADAKAGAASGAAKPGGVPVAAPMAAPVPASAPASAPAAAPAPVASAAVATPAPVATPASAATPQAPAPAEPSSAAGPAASAPASTASAATKRKPAPAPLVANEESLVDDLLGNPAMLLAGGAILAVLAVLGVLQLRRRRTTDSFSFGDSRLSPDSASGHDSKGRDPMSSLSYSPSQLDAAGDVDPVEEADVYLAYGRDQQAEEILKEAAQRTPTRVAIHAKLLEIYARRRDGKAFDQVAAEAFNLTKGQGPEWMRIKQLGNDLSPFNSLYQTERPASSSGTPSSLGRDSVRDSGFRQQQAMPPVPGGLAAGAPTPSPKATPLDLNLDFSAQDAPPAGRREPVMAPDAPPPGRPVASAPLVPPPAPPVAPPVVIVPPAPKPAPVPPTSSASRPAAPDSLPPLSLDIPVPGPAPKSPVPPAAASSAAASPAQPDFGMIEFDLDALSLAPVEKGEGVKPASAPAGASSLGTPNDPLEVKLELAVEFLAIGDREGARALVEEVLPQASGAVKTRAQQMLADLRR